MDAIGETIANVGLAQEIQNGLAKAQQVEPAWAPPEAVAAKTAELGSSSLPVLLSMELGKYVFDEWSKATGVSLGGDAGGGRQSVAFSAEEGMAQGNAAAWISFKDSAAFQLMCKYLAYAEKLEKEPILHKQFMEARPLGRGAFGAVYLVFKKVCVCVCVCCLLYTSPSPRDS